MASSGEFVIIGIVGVLFVATVIGALYLGFYIAGKAKDRPNYVLRGLFWSALLFFGGLTALAALVFGACLVIVMGLRH